MKMNLNHRWPLILALTLSPAAAQVRYPVLYTDMDGTSLGPDGQVRPATRAALARYRACGGQVGVATGRTLEQAKPHLKDLGPTLPLLLFNGGVTYGVDLKIKRIAALPPEALTATQAALKGLTRLGIVAHGAEETWIDAHNEGLDAFLKRARINAKGLIPTEGAPGLIKLMVVSRPEAQAALYAALKPLEATLEVMISSPETVEILPKGVNKATALKAVLSELGFNQEEVIFFGDSGNDTAVMRAIPMGVAMGNCHPDTCKAAALIADRNDTDTLAEIIERLAIDPRCVAGRGGEASALEELAKDPAQVEAGRALYARHCVHCHMARGAVGANLTDDIWVHGGQLPEILNTISEGVPARGMMGWKRRLKEADLRALAIYVYSLSAAKAP